MTDFISILVCYADMAEARRITQMLLEQRLVACANIMPQGESLYWWEGAIQSSAESYAFYKAPADGFAAIEKAIKAQHSYQVPCIVAYAIENGHGPFLNWIKAETTPR